MKKKEPNKCPICGKEVKTDNFRCNFEQMTGRAGWHLTFQPKVEMCDECSRKLLDYIERWFKVCNKTDIYRKPYC